MITIAYFFSNTTHVNSLKIGGGAQTAFRGAQLCGPPVATVLRPQYILVENFIAELINNTKILKYNVC